MSQLPSTGSALPESSYVTHLLDTNGARFEDMSMSQSSSIVVINDRTYQNIGSMTQSSMFEKFMLLPEESAEDIGEQEAEEEEESQSEELAKTNSTVIEQKTILSSFQTSLEALNLTYVQRIEELTSALEKANAENQALRRQVEGMRSSCSCRQTGTAAPSAEALSPSINKSFTCPKCGFVFSSVQALENHVDLCLEVKMFPE